MIRPPIEDVGGGQSVAFELPAKVLRNHSALRPVAVVPRLVPPLQASCLTDNILPFNDAPKLLAILSTEC
jgi:hypothetical protein